MAWLADWDNVLNADLTGIRPYVNDIRIAVSERQTVENFATTFNDPLFEKRGWSIDYTDLSTLTPSEDIPDVGLRTLTRFINEVDVILEGMLRIPKLFYFDGVAANPADGFIKHTAEGLTIGETYFFERFPSWSLADITAEAGYDEYIKPDGTTQILGTILKQRHDILNLMTHKWYEAEFFIDDSLSFPAVPASLKCEGDHDVIENEAKLLAQQRMTSPTTIGDPIRDPSNIMSNGQHSQHSSRVVWPVLFRKRSGVCPPTSFRVHFYSMAQAPQFGSGEWQSDDFVENQNNAIQSTTFTNEGSGTVYRSKLIGGGDPPTNNPGTDTGYVLGQPGVIVDFSGGFTKV